MADHSQQSQEIPSQIDLTSYLADVGVFSECLAGASGRDVALYVVSHVRTRRPELAAQLVALIAAFPLALAHRCSGDASAKLPPGVAAIPRIRSPEYTLAGPDFTGATTPPAALAICLELRFVLAEVARRNARRLPEVEAQVEAEMLM